MTSINEIVHTISIHFNITIPELTGTGRARYVARPRQIAMYLARELTTASFPEIGQFLGGKDHTTVMHAHKVVTELMRGDEDFCLEVLTLQAGLATGARQIDAMQLFVDTLCDDAHRAFMKRLKTVRKRLHVLARKDPLGLLERLEDSFSDLIAPPPEPKANEPQPLVNSAVPLRLVEPTPKKATRPCLGGCKKDFESSNPGHRICPECEPKIRRLDRGALA